VRASFPTLDSRSNFEITEETRKSERFITLSLFATIHGIGPVTARRLYGLGLRTLRDLEAYYEVDTSFTPAENRDGTEMDIRIALGLHDDLIMTCELRIRHRNDLLTPTQHFPRRGRSHPRNDYGPPECRRAWLRWYPRRRACVSCVSHGLSSFFFSSHLTRYRRGKPASNDIDVVFTHPNATSAKGLCARLVDRLRSAGLVTHVMREYLARACLASPYLQAC
jgi:DNA polymerase IV